MRARVHRSGIRSSELRELEDARERRRAAVQVVTRRRRRRAVERPPGAGWDVASLRAEVEGEFRSVGAKVFREDNES